MAVRNFLAVEDGIARDVGECTESRIEVEPGVPLLAGCTEPAGQDPNIGWRCAVAGDCFNEWGIARFLLSHVTFLQHSGRPYGDELIILVGGSPVMPLLFSRWVGRLQDRVYATSSTGYPASIHPSSPPVRGRTLVYPLSINMRATRAAEASFGHVQYSTTS